MRANPTLDASTLGGADALLLENSLIKEHKPFYNIQLKDDKTYPFIVIKKERFPRIFATRQLIRDGSEYFGPFPSVKVMHTVLDLCRKLYPIRSCALALTEDNIAKITGTKGCSLCVILADVLGFVITI